MVYAKHDLLFSSYNANGLTKINWLINFTAARAFTS